MKKNTKHIALWIALAGLLSLSPVAANAGNVGWNVSVGGGGYGGAYGGGYRNGGAYGGGYRYGGGWRPAAYGPGWGNGYGYGGWRGNWAGAAYYGGYPAAYYAPPVAYAPPVVAYIAPPEPLVLAAQPQPAVWYFCEATNNYFPYVQECPTGWKTQAATPPTSGVAPKRPQY